MNYKHLLITCIFFLSINLYKDLIMKILFFAVIISSSNLFSLNTYSQDIDLDCNCDYVINSSDEKWSNDTLNSYGGATTIISFIISIASLAQVGIGTSTPDASSLLDVSSTYLTYVLDKHVKY